MLLFLAYKMSSQHLPPKFPAPRDFLHSSGPEGEYVGNFIGYSQKCYWESLERSWIIQLVCSMMRLSSQVRAPLHHSLDLKFCLKWQRIRISLPTERSHDTVVSWANYGLLFQKWNAMWALDLPGLNCKGKLSNVHTHHHHHPLLRLERQDWTDSPTKTNDNCTVQDKIKFRLETKFSAMAHPAGLCIIPWEGVRETFTYRLTTHKWFI